MIKYSDHTQLGEKGVYLTFTSMSYYLGKVKEVCELFHTDQDYLSRDGTTCNWPSPSTSAGNQTVPTDESDQGSCN